MVDSIIIRLLFCSYVIWCRGNYRKPFCIPYYDELNLIGEDMNSSIIHELNYTMAQI